MSDEDENDNLIVRRGEDVTISYAPEWEKWRCPECGYEQEYKNGPPGHSRLPLGDTSLVKDGECPNCVGKALRRAVRRQLRGDVVPPEMEKVEEDE